MGHHLVFLSQSTNISVGPEGGCGDVGAHPSRSSAQPSRLRSAPAAHLLGDWLSRAGGRHQKPGEFGGRGRWLRGVQVLSVKSPRAGCCLLVSRCALSLRPRKSSPFPFQSRLPSPASPRPRGPALWRRGRSGSGPQGPARVPAGSARWPGTAGRCGDRGGGWGHPGAAGSRVGGR